MLPRERRLRQTRDINRVYSRGRFGGASQLTAKSLANGFDTSRVAIVVSRKVSTKAVVRNRIRRRIGSQVAESWQQIMPGYDIVITVRDDLSPIPVADLKRQLVTTLKRCGAMNYKEGSDV